VKKLCLLILISLICLSLSGCGFFLPYFFLNFTSADTQTQVQELPVGSDVDAKLNAEDIYWRSKFVAKDRVLQYSTNATLALTYTDDSWDSTIDMHYDTNVVLDPNTTAVNVQTLLSFDGDEPEEYWDYFRSEDDRLVYYYHEVETDYCSREVIDLDGNSPYTIILDYTIYGYPQSPQNLSVEPQTRILNDREVYVITFEQSALYTFGSTGNPVRDAELDKRFIPATWYVDVQTNLPVCQVFVINQVDDLLGDIIGANYQIADEDGILISGYTLSITYTSFEPVSVPPIPEDVLQKAWDNAGFSPN